MERRPRKFLVYLVGAAITVPLVYLIEYVFTGRWGHDPEAGAVFVYVALSIPIYGAYLVFDGIREMRDKERGAAVEATRNPNK